MNTIYKYLLPITDLQGVDLPKGAKILHVGEQEGGISLWAQVDTEAEKENRVFKIVGTGHPIAAGDRPQGLTFIGTVIQRSAPLVWHIFEVG